MAHLLFRLLLSALLVAASTRAEDDHERKDLWFKEVDEIVRLRGYQASEHLFVTEDGYILSLIRCTNPLIDYEAQADSLRHKQPLLFVHSTLSNNNHFVIHSVNAKPKDYSRIDASSLDEKELDDLLANDPARYNLPMLAMNFGHEVWFLNRRGSPRSRRRTFGRNAKLEIIKGGMEAIKKLIEDTIKLYVLSHVGPHAIVVSLMNKLMHMVSSVYGNFWTFSLDEQAAIDIPKTVDYILNETGKEQVAVLGHSTGAALVLMALARVPSLSRKISQAILWAPTAELDKTDGEMVFDTVLAPFSSYRGAFPPMAVEPLLQGALGTLCSNKLTYDMFCRQVLDNYLGTAGPNVDYSHGFSSATPKSVSVRELVHLSQIALGGGTRYFDYGDQDINRAHYGHDTPPIYHFSTITLKNITLVTGKQDNLVGPDDIQAIADKLSFKPKVKILHNADKFNHVSYFLNKNADRLIIVPTMRQIAASS